MLNHIILDYPDKTKLMGFVSTHDYHRGRRVVGALLAEFLPFPMSRSTILYQAIYFSMQLVEDHTD
jgi:nitric oxide reductase large subunit